MLVFLTKAKEALDREKSGSDFWRDWVLVDKWAAFVRRNYAHAEVVRHLENLEGSAMLKAVSKVTQETNRLKRQKAARDADA